MPEGSPAANPGFDVTSARLITALITERGVIEATRAAIAGSVPLNRIGEPDDMAGTAIFLASRAGRYLTGAVIPVDGGLSTIRR